MYLNFGNHLFAGMGSNMTGTAVGLLMGRISYNRLTYVPSLAEQVNASSKIAVPGHFISFSIISELCDPEMKSCQNENCN